MNSTDYTRLVRVTLFYYFEGAATALKRIGDQNLSEFRAFSVGYQSPRKSMGEQDPVLSGPRVVLWPPFGPGIPTFGAWRVVFCLIFGCPTSSGVRSWRT